ncbi:hypothetical protein BDV23DRAFT_105473 [Aspergillus alliaceus]|uniref:Uncharacterized protein n=1 Tax=Petromyces alliaceus TaxID=209559 RepID=A0A5N7CNM8_PETAA|nr:hypothetical protein BDV23DRAFT_105473 [Aspergillus alliaceus]
MSAERLVPKTSLVVYFPMISVYLILVLTVTSSLGLQARYKAPALYKPSHEGNRRDSECGRTQNLAGDGRTANTGGRRTLKRTQTTPSPRSTAEVSGAHLIRESYPNGSRQR